MLFVETKYEVQQKRDEMEMENPTHSFREMKHVLQFL